MNVNSGTRPDLMYVNAVASGERLVFNAGGGLDTLYLGSSGNLLGGIRGTVVFNAGSAGGVVSINDTADTTGDVFHLTASTLGAFAGDNLFGPGGSLQFSGLTNGTTAPRITLNLGAGADTIYAQPLAAARVTINANSPTSGTGDKLNLALASAQSPVV